MQEVTQNNVHIFLPYKAAKIAGSMKQNNHIGTKEALLKFYTSNAYRLLEQEETKLWHRSPEQIYTEYLRPHPKRHYQNGPRHSKLMPYAEQIHSWRKQGKSLRIIAQNLATYGCITTAQNLCKFLKNNFDKNQK